METYIRCGGELVRVDPFKARNKAVGETVFEVVFEVGAEIGLEPVSVVYSESNSKAGAEFIVEAGFEPVSDVLVEAGAEIMSVVVNLLEAFSHCVGEELVRVDPFRAVDNFVSKAVSGVLAEVSA